MKKMQRMFWNEHYRLHKSGWRKFTDFPENFLNLVKGKKVLELGCGNGKTIEGLLRLGAKKIIATDFSEIAVRLTQKKFSKEISNNKIEVLHANAVELPFKKESFDVIVCYHTLGAMLLTERKKCISEIFRLLKQKGVVLFEDFASGDLRENLEKLELVEKGTLQKRNGIIQHFFVEKEVGDLFSKFNIIQLETIESYLKLGGKRVLRSEVKGVFSKSF